MLSTQTSIFDNGIEEYGNASMMNNGLPGCVTWLALDDEAYCYVDHLEGSPKLQDGVAGFSEADGYSFEVFPLEGYPGLVAVHAVSRVNMVEYYSLYASKEAGEIPAELVYDFPHEDTILDGGQVIEINGTPYCHYGFTGTDFTVGSRLFTYEGRDCFSVPDYPEWIAIQYDADTNMYDLYYDTEKADSLPVDLLFEISGYNYSED